MKLQVNNVDIVDDEFIKLFEIFKTYIYYYLFIILFIIYLFSFPFIESIYISILPYSLKDISKSISFYELLFSITRKKHIFIELPKSTGIEKLDLYLHSLNRKDNEIVINEDMNMNEEEFSLFLQSLYSFPFITKIEINSIFIYNVLFFILFR